MDSKIIVHHVDSEKTIIKLDEGDKWEYSNVVFRVKKQNDNMVCLAPLCNVRAIVFTQED